jgi:hypothetical protein
MIARIWHGWTTPQNAARYETLLKQEIFVGIAQRKIPGYRGIALLKRPSANEVEFVTLMWFADMEGVRTFAGPDYDTAVVPPQARAVLARFDARSAHYETVCAAPFTETARHRAAKSLAAYCVVTGAVFALITLAHFWRIWVEGQRVALDPVFVALTLLAAGLSLWAWRLLGQGSRSDTAKAAPAAGA